ncbi:Endoplasmic reticulum zinc transporter [Mortierella alpina]|nr:Endoplasmic reticulum zinc transporter [Mortierella alpina]
MEANPQLLRRTHSPFVAAAAAAAASSTLAVETHTHQHTHHQHPHQHQHQHDHAHAVGQAQPHLSPLLGQGLRPTGRSSPMLAGDLNSHGGKQLNGAHGASLSTSSSVATTTTMNGDIPFAASTTQGHAHGLFDKTPSQHLDHHHLGHHEHGHDHGAKTGQVNGFPGGAHAGHAHEHQHHHPQNHHHPHPHQHPGQSQPQQFAQATTTTMLDTPIIILTDSTSMVMVTNRHTVIMATTTAMTTTTTTMATITLTPTGTRTGMRTGMIIVMITDMDTTTIIIVIQSATDRSFLPIIGLSYMTLFDAFGVLNTFISSVIHTDRNMKKSTVKHPFGIQRFAILFGLFNAIFLLFIGMNMLKESLEHLMLEDDHHGGDHGAVAQVPVFWTLVALGAALISTLGYQNHKQYCLLLNHTSPSSYGHSTSADVATLFRNPFALTSLGCVVGALMVAMFPRWDSLDKIVAIGQAIVMFWLGGPLTKVLGMILLQTAPPRALDALEDTIRQLSGSNPAIQRIERAHVWTNTVGQLIGTLIVTVAKGSDEQVILASIHERLRGFLDMDGQVDGAGELTVQLVHSH